MNDRLPRKLENGLYQYFCFCCDDPCRTVEDVPIDSVFCVSCYAEIIELEALYGDSK